jgi:hypothetical protein
MFSRNLCMISQEHKNGGKMSTLYPHDKDAHNRAVPSFERERISYREYFSRRLLSHKKNSTIDIEKRD